MWDITEDLDDDNDGKLDGSICALGNKSWTSTPSDYDADG